MEDPYFSHPSLAKTPPIVRAAYSDRTAWIMAELSRLVYEPLPQEKTVTSLVDELFSAVKEGKQRDIVEALIAHAVQTQEHVTPQTEEVLKKANLEFLEAFAIDDTEAFLARLLPTIDFPGMLVLAFRGTQPTRIKDIATDFKTDLVSAPPPGGGRVHRGFLEAFQKVQTVIADALNKHKGPPLYITGHSLGGALALVATRYLASDSTGATYTFGAPRAADDEFYRNVKTPVYRVVNAADAVTRVPLGYILVLLLSLLRLLPFNGTRWISELLRKHLVGYTHYGSLMFLTAPANVPDDKSIPFKGLKMKQSPDIFFRSALVIRRVISTRGKALYGDHSILEYSQKLLAYARRRN